MQIVWDMQHAISNKSIYGGLIMAASPGPQGMVGVRRLTYPARSTMSYTKPEHMPTHDRSIWMNSFFSTLV